MFFPGQSERDMASESEQKTPAIPATRPTSTVKRIFLADDHALMLEGLTRLLEKEFQVVGTATSGRMLLDEIDRLHPDVVLLDVGMPEMNGIEAARRLSKTHPEIKIIFVSQQLDPAYLHAAFNAGAKAYVAKQSAAQELVRAIRLALRDRFYVTPLAMRDTYKRPAFGPRVNPATMFGAELTPRQREVLQLIAEGKSTKEISAALNISIKTVEFHRNGLMDELGIRTTAELTRYALSRGIVA